MSSDRDIRSIIDRYENDLPVTPEEKALFHTWLLKRLRIRKQRKPDSAHFATQNSKGSLITSPMIVRRSMPLQKPKGFWAYALIVLILLTIAAVAYLFREEFRTATPADIASPHGQVHSNDKKIR